MPARWEGDDRGYGVASAAQLVPGATELVAAFDDDSWVTEDPHAHLLPHIENWCRSDGRLRLRDAHVDERHAYVVTLEWQREPAGLGHVRAAAFALIGSFAEGATYVRQRRDAARGEVHYEVGTGEVGPDAAFHPHGHTVVLTVVGVGSPT